MRGEHQNTAQAMATRKDKKESNHKGVRILMWESDGISIESTPLVAELLLFQLLQLLSQLTNFRRGLAVKLLGVFHKRIDLRKTKLVVSRGDPMTFTRTNLHQCLCFAVVRTQLDYGPKQLLKSPSWLQLGGSAVTSTATDSTDPPRVTHGDPMNPRDGYPMGTLEFVHSFRNYQETTIDCFHNHGLCPPSK